MADASTAEDNAHLKTLRTSVTLPFACSISTKRPVGWPAGSCRDGLLHKSSTSPRETATLRTAAGNGAGGYGQVGSNCHYIITDPPLAPGRYISRSRGTPARGHIPMAANSRADGTTAFSLLHKQTSRTNGEIEVNVSLASPARLPILPAARQPAQSWDHLVR